MQTYYDFATRQWVTRLPNGTTRPASVDEATKAGAPAPTPDAGSGPGGTSSSSDSMRWVTGYKPPSTDPYQNWLSADPGSRSYRYLTGDLKQYYEQHPDEAYRQYTNAEFGDRQTPLLDYARGRYQDYWAQYIKASEADPAGGAGWTDYQTNNLANQIRQSFNMQSPTQKGYSLTFMPAGRTTF